MEQNPSNLQEPKAIGRSCSIFSLEFPHKRKESLESLYASVQSMSVSISDGSSSADSVAVGKIQNINRDLMEMVNSRLTAFYYFNNLSKGSAQESLVDSISSLEDMKNSINKEMEGLNESPDRFLVVSQVLKQIVDLQKLHQDELEKLRTYNEEIHSLNYEEGELHERLQGIEKKCNRLVLEDKSERAACNCLLF